VGEQLHVFGDADEMATAAGLTVRWRSLANTPGTLAWPATRLNLVRCGIGIYGISPFERPHPSAGGLRPAMTLRARVALTKRVPAGSGVSYGLTYRTVRESTLALVPIGYADGIPRTAGPEAAVWLAGRRRPIAGRIAMDQFVIDCGDDPVTAGDEVVIFGGEPQPTAAEWAAACGTIGYEIVTRIGPRVPRRYVGSRSAPVRPSTA
jgi:alanine racemase